MTFPRSFLLLDATFPWYFLALLAVYKGLQSAINTPPNGFEPLTPSLGRKRSIP